MSRRHVRRAALASVPDELPPTPPKPVVAAVVPPPKPVVAEKPKVKAPVKHRGQELILQYIEDGGTDPFWVPRLHSTVPVPPHGTRARYQRELRFYGAGCEVCRAAVSGLTVTERAARNAAKAAPAPAASAEPTPPPAPREEPAVSTPAPEPTAIVMDMAEEVFAAALARKAKAATDPEPSRRDQRHPATITAERILRAAQVYERGLSVDELSALLVAYRALMRIGRGDE